MDFSLTGSASTGTDFNAIDVQLVSCGSQYTIYNGTVIGADDSCILDKKKVEKHLGTAFFMKVYYNHKNF